MITTKIKKEFLSGIYFNNILIFNSYTYSLEISPNTNDPDKLNAAFTRINYFCDRILSSAIFVDETDIEAIDKLRNADLLVLTLPYPGPADQIILEIITKKIQAMTDDTIEILGSKISSILMNMAFLYVPEEDEEDEEDEKNNLTEPNKWWNLSEPHFTNLIFDEKGNLDCDVLKWEDLDLNFDHIWDTSFDDYENNYDEDENENDEDENENPDDKNLIYVKIKHNDN